ncbi:MAG: hypothetical protein ACREOS_13320 [Candidatus Dormibacteraceae bacterium]
MLRLQRLVGNRATISLLDRSRQPGGWAAPTSTSRSASIIQRKLDSPGEAKVKALLKKPSSATLDTQDVLKWLRSTLGDPSGSQEKDAERLIDDEKVESPLHDVIGAFLGTPFGAGALDSLENAIKNGVSPATLRHLYGLSKAAESTGAEIGAHPSWVNEQELGKWATGLGSTDKYKTLLAVNKAKNNQAVKGKELLYLGADSDVEHPLFTTPATDLTLVSQSNAGLAGTTNQIEAKLKKYAKPGFNVVKKLTGETTSVISVIQEEGDHVVLTINYHEKSYDTYIAESSGKKHDIVMDKDSWLKEWKSHNDREVVDAIAEQVKQGGLWLGGFETTNPKAQSQLISLFDDVTGTLESEARKWSGYESLNLRKRSAKEVGGISEGAAEEASDGVWETVQQHILPLAEEHLSGKSVDKNQYDGFIKALENVLPYVEGINEAHFKKLAEVVVAKLEGKADGWEPRLAEVQKDIEQAAKSQD